MKIVILDMDNLKNPHWGSGQAVETREVFKRLAKKHEIIVYTSKYPNYKDYEVDGITYKHIGLASNNSQLNNLAFVSTIPFLVPHIKADLIMEVFAAPFSTCFTPAFTKIPVVARTSFFAAETLGKKYKIKFETIEKIGIQKYKYLVALNEGDLKKAKNLNSKIDSRVIYNGVKDSYLSKITTEKNYILYIGRLDINQKGLDLLIQAFSIAALQITDDLYIMGSGTKSDEEKLKKLVSEKKLNRRIKLLGKLSGSKKDKYFSECKYVVFPSRFEGQSIGALESVALGKPIVCFDIPGFQWAKDKFSLKAKGFSVDEYSKNLIALSKNKELRKRLGKNAKAWASKHTWDRSAEEYEKYFTYILSKSIRQKYSETHFKLKTIG